MYTDIQEPMMNAATEQVGAVGPVSHKAPHIHSKVFSFLAVTSMQELKLCF